MIFPGVFLFFLKKKYNIVNIKILKFFIGPLQLFTLMNSYFSSSSINPKQKFWGVLHLLHVFWFFYYRRIIFQKILLGAILEN